MGSVGRAVWLLGLWMMILASGLARADGRCVLAFDGMDIVPQRSDSWLIVVWSAAGQEIERDTVPLRDASGSIQPLELEVACGDMQLVEAEFAVLNPGASGVAGQASEAQQVASALAETVAAAYPEAEDIALGEHFFDVVSPTFVAAVGRAFAGELADGREHLLRDMVLFPPDLEPLSFSRTYATRAARTTVYFSIQRRRSLAQTAAELTAAPAHSTVHDWAMTYTAARDPLARRPDISVDIRPSLTVPGAWKIALREHIANAEQPLTLQVDGVSPKRVVSRAFGRDIWGEVSENKDDADDPPPAGALETFDVFDLPERGIQLGLYQLVSAGKPSEPALRYLRAQTPNVTASDVVLTAHSSGRIPAPASQNANQEGPQTRRRR
jgi:hypothetical protein